MAGQPENSPGEEQVRELLLDCFPIDRRKRMSHEDCVQLRSRLISLRSEDVPGALADVLEDLLETHSTDPNDAEAVIRYLNASGEGTDMEFIRKQWGDEALDKAKTDEKILRTAKMNEFACLDKKQAQAIVEWLTVAKTWPELRGYTSQADAALAYWRARSSS
ncbi:MAG TPA: hypothetical protein VH619_17000 [Verrucomicrobiae bacterium]|jgi:hypothetical protein|nr:hypothetical protein [Verrucomicrobiae bacterium]